MKQIFLLLLFYNTLISQLFISEIERNPIGSESELIGGKSLEYIEVVNLSLDTFKVDSLSISDNIKTDKVISVNQKFLYPGNVLLILDKDYFALPQENKYNYPLDCGIATVNHTALLDGLSSTDGIKLLYKDSVIDYLADDTTAPKLIFTSFIGKDEDSTTISTTHFFEPADWEERNANPGSVSFLNNIAYREYTFIGDTVILDILSFRDRCSITVSKNQELQIDSTINRGINRISLPFDSSNINSLISTIKFNENTIVDTINLTTIRVDSNALYISEVSPRGENEFIELYNSSNEGISLQNWQLTNMTDSFTITRDIRVTAHSFFVLCKDSIFGSNYTPVDDWFSLNNYRDTLILKSPFRVEDSIIWNSKNYFKWNYESLNRLSKDDGTSPNAFALSTPNPNTISAVYTENTPITLSIPKPLFSPNGDRRDDSLVIKVTKPSYYKAVARIFSELGEEVKRIEFNGNRAVWDGKEENGYKARRGAYIVLVEFSTTSGEDEMLRKGIALWR